MCDSCFPFWILTILGKRREGKIPGSSEKTLKNWCKSFKCGVGIWRRRTSNFFLSIASFYCVSSRKHFTFIEALFQAGYSSESLFCGSDISPRKCSGNDDRLSNYKITVVGVIIIILQNYTHQKYHVLWWSLQEISVGCHSRLLINNMLSRKGSARIKIK